MAKNSLCSYSHNGYSDLIIRPFIRPSLIIIGGVTIKSEHEIQNEILLELSKSGTTVCRSNAGKIKTKDGRTIALFPKGWPDITGFRHSDGKMILIECKNDRGRLRKDQQQFEKFISQYPVIYGVARSVDDALAIVDKE
ncbi:VRR-NUC domain-containing protein [Levilactobacillus tongjiangensis]|uniref:VRR-NUC domain-containing protein n=1 Tax=Levilactobacillus tongjiangensis TaxID=2486023 RepID=A0ABW1SVL5_9LACO|nr:VRR-NUC domain-containing protein [Levilactobacillus tongjiangensis]